MFYRAGTLFDNGDFSGALRLWEPLRQAHPAEAMLHFVLGRCEHRLRSFDKASASYKKAIALDPEFWQAYYHSGSLLLEQAQYAQAIEVFYRLLQHQPGDGDTWTLLGGALSKTGEQDAAIECCRQALRLKADDAAAMYNLAFAYAAKGMHGEALKWTEAVLRQQPDVPMFHMQRAGLLLREGRYAEGWREWEWRLKKQDFRALNKRSSLPYLWKGEPLQGKTLLVWCEQGLGDTIQFARYLRSAKELGARVIFECQKELMPLVSAIEGADAVFERFTAPPERFDYHVPLMSLPMHCDTTLETIPDGAGYLNPGDATPFAARFSFSTDTMRIGFAWEGSRLNPANHYRSCTPDAYAPFFDLPHCSFYGLQHTIGSAPLPAALCDLGVRSMAELAGAIASLDLIVTIDTSVAHLAGAMGKEVWLMLSALPDWRWAAEGETTPWYDSMHLFRQKKIGDWRPVMMDAAQRLRARLMNEPTDRR
jgi:tetratricopeptide (TPR) repeat protein